MPGLVRLYAVHYRSHCLTFKICRCTIGDRDIYLAEAILDAESETLVAAVDIIHVEAVEQYLIREGGFVSKSETNTSSPGLT